MARWLLCLGAMSYALPSCVLPPPPIERPSPVQGLSLRYDRLEPSAALITIVRDSTKNQPFSVALAIEQDDERTANVFWYVAFDPQTGGLPDFNGTRITLNGCDGRLAGKNLFVVEALVTYASELDTQRLPVTDEPVVRAQWFLEVEGDGSLCNL